MLGDNDEILGSVPQNAGIIQQQQNRNQDIGRQRADVAQAPQNAAGKAGAEQSAINEANSITITPQMAKGLKTMTGQSWDQTIGTKWRGDVFTAVTTGMAQAKYHQDVISGKIDIEQAKEEAAAAKQEQADTDKAANAEAIENLKDKHKKEDEDIESKHKEELQKLKDSTKQTPEDKEKADAIKYLQQAREAKNTGDSDVEKTATANYNSLAQKYKLEPIDTESGFDKAIASVKALGSKVAGALDKSGKDAKKTEEAKAYLKKNKLPVTDANIKHYLDQSK